MSVGDILKYATVSKTAMMLKILNPPEQSTATNNYNVPPSVSSRFRGMGSVKDLVEYYYPCPPGQAEFLSQGARTEQMWTLPTAAFFLNMS